MSKAKNEKRPVWAFYGGADGRELICETSFTRGEIKRLFPGARISKGAVILAAVAAIAATGANAQDMDAAGIYNAPAEAMQAQAQNRIANSLETLAQDQATWSNQLEVTRSYGRAYVPTMSQTDF